MNNNVCILMSTYNGGQYLKEQIESILNQDVSTIQILVRDDGSNDETTEILNIYQSLGSIRILNSEGNLGPAGSFMELLYYSPEADYYAFADQDDIWKPEKISRAVNLIGDKDFPALYASNQQILQDGTEKGYRFVQEPNITLTGIICANHLSGCTMVFNKKLRDILVNKQNRPDEQVLKLRMHDTWVAAVAACCGEIIYDPESFILYRIHDSNTVGVNSGTLKKRVSKTINKIMNPNQRNGRSRFANELLKISDMNDNSKEIVLRFARSETNRIAILRNKDIKKDCPESRPVFVIKALLGWH